MKRKAKACSAYHIGFLCLSGSVLFHGWLFVYFEVKSICLEIGSLLLWRLLIHAANSLFYAISLFVTFHLFFCGNTYKATTAAKRLLLYGPNLASR